MHMHQSTHGPDRARTSLASTGTNIRSSDHRGITGHTAFSAAFTINLAMPTHTALVALTVKATNRIIRGNNLTRSSGGPAPMILPELLERDVPPDRKSVV